MADKRFKNTIKDLDGKDLDIYLDQIHILAEDFINTCLCKTDKDNVINNNIMDSITFNSMILYVKDNMNVLPDNDDIGLLDNMFNIYYKLCCKFKILPTLEMFSIMVDIDYRTFSDWQAGKSRLGSFHADTVKKWKNICKNSLVNSLQNSHGTDANKIFIAKAAYGMVETAPVQMINQEQKRSAEQIAADYTAEIAQNDTIEPDF